VLWEGGPVKGKDIVTTLWEKASKHNTTKKDTAATLAEGFKKASGKCQML